MATSAEVGMTGIEGLVLRAQTEPLLYPEASLHKRGFSAWLGLFTPEATYRSPAADDEINPNQDVSIVYDAHTASPAGQAAQEAALPTRSSRALVRRA